MSRTKRERSACTCLCLGSRASFARQMAALVRAERAPPPPPELAKREMSRGIPSEATTYSRRCAQMSILRSPFCFGGRPSLERHCPRLLLKSPMVSPAPLPFPNTLTPMQHDMNRGAPQFTYLLGDTTRELPVQKVEETDTHVGGHRRRRAPPRPQSHRGYCHALRTIPAGRRKERHQRSRELEFFRRGGKVGHGIFRYGHCRHVRRGRRRPDFASAIVYSRR